MNDVIGSVRQVIQDFLAPELRQHRAELVAIRGELGTKIDSVESRLDSKIDSLGERLDGKIESLEERLDGKIESVEARLDGHIEALKSEMRSGFTALGAALENAVLRGELSTTREIADLRIRVERLERDRGQLHQ